MDGFASANTGLEDLIGALTEEYESAYLAGDSESALKPLEEALTLLLEQGEPTASASELASSAQPNGEDHSATVGQPNATGAEVMKFPKTEAFCQIEYETENDFFVYCHYGLYVDSSRETDSGDVITNERFIGKVEIYRGGSFDAAGDYRYDGEFEGKYSEVVTWNENSGWYVEIFVGVDGDGLPQYCSVRTGPYGYKHEGHAKENCKRPPLQELLADVVTCARSK